MNLERRIPKKSSGPALPVTLFATGVVFTGIVWVINVYFIATSYWESGNYYISKAFAGLSYVSFVVLISSLFAITGLLNIIHLKRKVFSVAVIISSLCVSTHTLLMKSVFKTGQEIRIHNLEEGLLCFNPNDPDDPYYGRSAYMVLLNHECLKLSIGRWNEVEPEKIEPQVTLVSVVGDWKLEAEDHSGICQFSYQEAGVGIKLQLTINDESFEYPKNCLPQEITEDGDLYKVRMAVWGWGPEIEHLKSNIEGFLDGFYLEMNLDQTSFFIYEDETKSGRFFGPFKRQ